MRIGLIHVAQETNDFNPEPTNMRDYRSFGLHLGSDVIAKSGGKGQVGGHLKAVANSGLEVETVPIVRAHAVAGGRIDDVFRAYFLDVIRKGLKDAGRLDGLHLQLHGACAAVGLDDVEGGQADLCREILGPDVPILLGLDHHANVTQRMVDAVDAIVGHRTQPHDPFDTGVIGGALLLRMIRERLRPVIAMRKIPLVTHQEKFLTAHGPMKEWFDRARAMETDPRVLQAAPFPMQPWLDVSEGGWTAVVVTNDDRALAERLADELADHAWSLRHAFMEREALDVDEAVRIADAEPKGVVVLSDTGDTVFGGSAGDSNILLEAMLRLGIRGPALIPMIAPGVVARLFEAGEGARVTLPIGGETATAFFRPIEVTGIVRRLGRRHSYHRRLPGRFDRHGPHGRLRGRPRDDADQRVARRRRQLARGLSRIRHRADRLQDRGPEDRVEFPVLRAHRFTRGARRYRRTGPVRRLHPPMVPAPPADFSARRHR